SPLPSRGKKLFVARFELPSTTSRASRPSLAARVTAVATTIGPFRSVLGSNRWRRVSPEYGSAKLSGPVWASGSGEASPAFSFGAAERTRGQKVIGRKLRPIGRRLS